MNGSLLTLAREARCLTQSALADATGISQPVVSKIESGLRGASQEEVEIFSRILHYPVSLFERPEQVYKQSAIVDFMFRRGMSVKQRSLTSVWARLELMALHLKPLLDAVSIESPLKLPHLPSVPREGGPTGVAAKLRIMWRLPAGPIQGLLSLVEDAGVLIVPFSFNDEKIDAVSVCRPDMPPLIFMDFTKPADRIRANCAHELGHLIMHVQDRDAMSDPDRDVEGEAFDFAGDFLVPGNDFRNHVFSGIGLREFEQLKVRWGVSMQLLIMRAAQEGSITEVEKTNYFKAMSSRGWRKQEPGYVATEQPHLLGEILRALREDLQYSVEELARLSGLFEEEFRGIIIGEAVRSVLRVVPKSPDRSTGA